MKEKTFSQISSFFSKTMSYTDGGESVYRYKVIRRNMIILMVVVTILPLFLMTMILSRHLESMDIIMKIFMIQTKSTRILPLLGLWRWIPIITIMFVRIMNFTK